MGENINVALILRDIRLMQKKLDEIEEELLKLKIQNLEEEELSEGGTRGAGAAFTGNDGKRGALGRGSVFEVP